MTTTLRESNFLPGVPLLLGRQAFLFLGGTVLIAFVAGARLVNAQDEEDSPYRPGLVAAYSAGAMSVTRTDEVLAFDWQDRACDPRLPAGEFSAMWRGRLWARGSGAYRVLAYASGDVSLKIAGKQVLSGSLREPGWLTSEPLDLEFDHHPLEVTYRRAGARGQLALFWSGPDFQLEPIPARALVHDREQTPATDFERGRQLAAALRCAACHKDDSSTVSPAPALDRLTGNIQENWMIDWLSDHGLAAANGSDKMLRRMPLMSLDRQQATAIAAWLLREPALETAKASEQTEAKVTKGKTAKTSSSKAKKGDEKPRPSASEGERLLLTRGCLACHQVGALGESGLFGGGDLTGLLAKRPVGFLTRWLHVPAAINRSHRMPEFSLSGDDLESLRLWEVEQGRKAAMAKQPAVGGEARKALVRQGEELVKSFRCANCHVVSRASDQLAEAAVNGLSKSSHWSRSCAGEPAKERHQPGYLLGDADRRALEVYYAQSRPGERQLAPQARGRDLLVQLNCLACHQREGVERAASLLPAVLQDKLVDVAAAHSGLAEQVPAMTPPALNSVGDKLLDEALAASISRAGAPHRPYLLVQMPKFKLTKGQLESLTAYFTGTDRIPANAPVSSHPLSNPHAPREAARSAMPGDISRSAMATSEMPALLAAGPRLVTTDGLACTSCHAVGSVQPAKAPLNARGPDISQLGKRIRREWFDRWCADPARIVPRMEMPSVKIPVRGVLNDNVKDQLAAVWHILNTPGFEPPEPNPVRTLRLSGVPEKNERPIVIHDVVKDGDKTYLYPLVIGLPNRHNVLFDLETNRLAAWWLGDTARQRTKGKSWYWEQGGKSILPVQADLSELTFQIDGKVYTPRSRGQFAAELVKFEEQSFSYRLTIVPLGQAEGAFREVLVGQEFRPELDRDITGPIMLRTAKGETGFTRTIWFRDVNVEAVTIRLVSAGAARSARWNEETKTVEGLADGQLAIKLNLTGRATWNGDGTVTVAKPEPSKDDPTAFFAFGPFIVSLTYLTTVPVDTFRFNQTALPLIADSILQVAPGFEARRLPLPVDIMPSGLHWLNDELLFVTLKGQLYSAKDTDSDGSEDKLTALLDGLATPYGLNSTPETNVLIAAKDALLKIEPPASNFGEYGAAEKRIAASGWGYTDDYHDWAVGLPAGDSGDFYLALPCQQDARSEAAAHLRGKIIRLVPKYNAHPLFDIEIISAGHRFPMGMARNRDGELFVTDNQGNYNPFNELNHVKKGAHFGFINALEKEKGFTPPPLTPPAINIPHPWTRSVNGICFLESPAQPLRDGRTGNVFGPLEGHLVGCEYDTRRLIRMSLQKVGDTYQGAAYPLSIPTEDVEKGLLGPIVCAIKPTTGELYVGEIRDSGWGASNNIGQITKIKIEPEKFACGIAEVRATSTGFTVDFLQPVDAAKALNTASYAIESYRRESTPAYGGSDIDRRSEGERIKNITLSPDKKRATLTFSELRTGHVYEFKLKSLTPGGGMFHPDEAHYTLHRLPE